MRINNNIMAMNAHRQLGVTNAAAGKTLEKLSSGMRINRAGDDAAGLAISEKMRGQIRGLNMASKNAQDGISFIQTAEGALTESHAILQRMRELAVQSANDTNISVDRNEIQKEIDQLAQELTRVANDTEFNQQTLLNGGITGAKFHIGANAGQDITLEISAMDAATLGVARDTFAGDVSDNVKVTGAEIDDLNKGTEIFDGNSLTLSADASAAKGIDSTTGLQTIAETSQFNGYTVEVTSSAGDGSKNSFVIDHNAKTITINQDTTQSSDESDFNAWLSNEGGDAALFSFSAITEGSGTIDNGLGDDEVKLTLGTEEVIVKNDVKSVTFTSNENKGLTLNFDGTTLDGSTAATITISEEKATAATFENGELKNKAVADKGIDVSTQGAASGAITTIQSAIETVSAERSKLGAMQNRLEHTIRNLDTSAENLQASESRIRDIDMAAEMMEFTKNNILQQAATAMLAQANQAPSSVLQLLR